MRTSRIRKSDPQLIQIQKLIASNVTRPTGPGVAVVVGGGAGPLGSGAAGVRITVMAYGNSFAADPSLPSSVTRTTLNPQGAMYAVDDAAHDKVDLRYSIMADPLVALFRR